VGSTSIRFGGIASTCVVTRILPYVKLCRLPAVFTAMADIFLGWLLVHDALTPELQFAFVLCCSSCLYLAGMVLNDLFDRTIDAQERPRRPIPSGAVSVRAATLFAVVLLSIGLATAIAAGPQTLLMGALLTAFIFLYDGLLKSTPAGPLAMGACRFLNVLLGSSTAVALETGLPELSAVWKGPQVLVALALGTYIVGVTWFARNEAGKSNRWQLAGALGVVNLGLVILLGLAMNWPAQAGLFVARSGFSAALALGCIGVIINRRLVMTIADPIPAKVQAAVRTMLLSLIILDASILLVATENRWGAIAVALLVIPAQLLGRFLAMT
jgi:4-hydroxybenzoate polyprenyltransferase